MRYSVIIPVSRADTYLAQCVDHCLKLTNCQFEVILLPDQPLVQPATVRVIPTNTPSPSEKRNIGIAAATGDICAFIDADAYPATDWLEKAGRYFDDPAVGAVGGPNLTPSDDTDMQKAAGVILESPLGTGDPDRHRPGKLHDSRELQSVNMLVRKSVLEKIGGFDPSLYPGEDAKLSYQITAMARMVYAPEVVVYHHRRKLFRPFLRQMWYYGLTKPRALKARFSFRHVFFFIPTTFLLGLVGGPPLMAVQPIVAIPYFAILGIYVLGLLWSARRAPSLKTKAAAFVGIFLTHIAYGTAMIGGFFKGRRQ